MPSRSSFWYARPALLQSGKGVDLSKRRWQHLDAHLRNVSAASASFFINHELETIASVIGKLHDLGKFSPEFQTRLEKLARKGRFDANHEPEGSAGRVDHSTAGAMKVFSEMYKAKGPLRSLTEPSPQLAAAIVIAFHHGGLRGPEELRVRFEEEERKRSEKRPTLLDKALHDGVTHDILAIPPLEWPASFMRELPESRQDARRRLSVRFAFMLYRLYSALLDADFLDAERHMRPWVSAKRRDTSTHALEKMSLALQDSMQSGDLQKTCIISAESPSGIFELSWPNRDERILGAIVFAMEHARRHKLSRVFVVLNSTSPIHEISAKIRGAIAKEGFDSDSWMIEHHQSLLPDEESEVTRLSSENMDAALILISDAAFFESIFSASASAKRAVHRLYDAAIVLDDFRPPIAYLSPCVEAIADLARSGSSVLFSGRFHSPYLSGVARLGGGRASGIAALSGKTPVRVPTPILKSRARKLSPRFLKAPISMRSLALSAVGRKAETIAVILNDASDAAQIYRLIVRSRRDALFIAETLCPIHRRSVLDRVRKRVSSGRRVCLVGTDQVIASMEGSFDVVYRELSGLDDLSRAASLVKGGGSFCVVELDGHGTQSSLHEKGMAIVKDWLLDDVHPDLDNPDQMDRYFDQLHSVHSGDGYGIMDLLASWKFRDVSEKFLYHGDRDAAFVIAPFDGLDKAIASFRNRNLFLYHRLRALQGFAVKVPRAWLERASKAKAVSVEPQLGVPFIHKESAVYDQRTGLQIESIQ